MDSIYEKDLNSSPLKLTPSRVKIKNIPEAPRKAVIHVRRLTAFQMPQNNSDKILGKRRLFN